jgi:hypothetical protein
MATIDRQKSSPEKVKELEYWNNGMMEYWVHLCSIWLKNNMAAFQAAYQNNSRQKPYDFNIL